MKKIMMLIVALVMAVSASAQFEEGKMYANASLSNLGLSYNGTQKLNIGLNGKVGYCFQDNWMALASIGLDDAGKNAGTNFSAGVGCRYYIIQNGIYLGLNAQYKHLAKNYNDFMPGLEIGYAFFINRHCTVEPAIYYDQSLKNHSDYSIIGFRVGFGIYM